MVHRIEVDGGDANRLHAQTTVASSVPRQRRPLGADPPGVPNDFGFVVLAHPSRGETAWVIPIDPETMFPPDGRLRPRRTDDAGGTGPRGSRAPDGHYASVCATPRTSSTRGRRRLAFGTRNGCVFASLDGGASFTEVVFGLPVVLSVRLSP